MLHQIWLIFFLAQPVFLKTPVGLDLVDILSWSINNLPGSCRLRVREQQGTEQKFWCERVNTRCVRATRANIYVFIYIYSLY